MHIVADFASAAMPDGHVGCYAESPGDIDAYCGTSFPNTRRASEFSVYVGTETKIVKDTFFLTVQIPHFLTQSLLSGKYESIRILLPGSAQHSGTVTATKRRMLLQGRLHRVKRDADFSSGRLKSIPVLPKAQSCSHPQYQW